MLLSQQGSGHQNSDLFALIGCQESRAHGDFCFTEAYITAYQAIHGLRCAHILNNGIDCLHLVGRFLKREGIGE